MFTPEVASELVSSANLIRRIISEEVSRQLSGIKLSFGAQVDGSDMSAAYLISNQDKFYKAATTPAKVKRGRGRPKKTASAPTLTPTPKAALSAAGRAAIIAAQKKRWAAKRKAEKAVVPVTDKAAKAKKPVAKKSKVMASPRVTRPRTTKKSVKPITADTAAA